MSDHDNFDDEDFDSYSDSDLDDEDSWSEESAQKKKGGGGLVVLLVLAGVIGVGGYFAKDKILPMLNGEQPIPNTVQQASAPEVAPVTPIKNDMSFDQAVAQDLAVFKPSDTLSDSPMPDMVSPEAPEQVDFDAFADVETDVFAPPATQNNSDIEPDAAMNNGAMAGMEDKDSANAIESDDSFDFDAFRADSAVEATEANTASTANENARDLDNFIESAVDQPLIESNKTDESADVITDVSDVVFEQFESSTSNAVENSNTALDPVAVASEEAESPQVMNSNMSTSDASVASTQKVADLEQMVVDLTKQLEAQNTDTLMSEIETLKQANQKLLAENARLSKKTAAPKRTVKSTTMSKPVAKKITRVSKVWVLRSAKTGSAWVSEKGHNDLRQVKVGDTLDGIGKIKAIDYKTATGWTIQGTSGHLAQ